MDNRTTVGEAAIRQAHASGRRHAQTGDWDSYYTPVLQAAYDCGQAGHDLGPVVECERYGSLPVDGRSRNHADDCWESGVSVIRAGTNVSGSEGAHLWMSARPVVAFRGILIVNDTGSDGEPVVLPVGAHEDHDS